MKKILLVTLYIILSVTWIIVTDLLVMNFAPSNLYSFLNSLKGMLFVIISAFLLYLLLKKNEVVTNVKEDNKKLDTLINAMVDFVNFKDGEGRWLKANEFGLKLFQLEKVDYVDKTDAELAKYSDFYHDALLYCETSDEETWQKGKITRCEEILPMPNDRPRTFDTIKVPLFKEDGSRDGLVVIGRDVTENLRAQELLENSREQYRSLFEYNPNLIFMIDINDIIININDKLKAITGYEKEEFIGHNISLLIPSKYSEPLNQNFEQVKRFKCPQTMVDIEIEHKEGHLITLSITSVPIVLQDEVSGIIVVVRDITDLKKAEDQLLKSEKLSVVGELAASVAHEIRNPLTSLKGFLQLLQKNELDSSQFYYNIMLNELNRINDIVGELLVLSRPQPAQFNNTDIETIVKDVITLLESQANMEGIMLNLDLDLQDRVIECEANQIKQLLINVVKNAIEASPPNGNIYISIKEIFHSHLLFQVSDQGHGMSTERIKRLGEPFYSSKEKGTGLGLTVSHKIVETHGGKIEFYSELNQGTRVDILLPRKRQAQPN